MKSENKAIIFSEYSFLRIFSNLINIFKKDTILFMPNTGYYKYANRYKRYLLVLVLKSIMPRKEIKEVALDEVIELFWTSNYDAAHTVSKKKLKFEKHQPVKLLNSMINDSTVVNYFQASLTKDIFYQNLFSSLIKEQSKKYAELLAIGDYLYIESLGIDSEQGKVIKLPQKTLNFFQALKDYCLCLLIPIYFIIKTLRNGLEKYPEPLIKKLAIPVISGINSESSENISEAKGIKFSSDDTFIYGKNLKVGEVVHVFNFWEFEPEIKKSFIKNMEERNISYLDVKNFKMNLETLKFSFIIFFQILKNLFKHFEGYNDWYVLKMNSYLPKAILHILSKHLEIKNIKPKVEVIRNDYNPASILRAILSKQNQIKTLGIQHTATPYDCPQLSFINYDHYLLFGELYKEKFSNLLADTKVSINGKDFLDPVIRLKRSNKQQKIIKERFSGLYGNSNRHVMIVLPGNSPMIRKSMRLKLLAAIKEWSKSSQGHHNKIIIRFRKKIEIKTVKEWGEIFNLAKRSKNIIVDFENFTTQELMYLSDRIIIPHSSYSMTEAMALKKEAFSFDFSGSAFYYFDKYGKGLVLKTEEELYESLSIDNLSISKSIDYQKLSSDLDTFYDGKNVERLRNLVLDLSK